MKSQELIWLAVFVPILGAFLLPLVGAVSKGARNLSAPLPWSGFLWSAPAA